MKTLSLFSLSGLWHLIALLTVLVFECPINTEALENEHEITNEDYSDFTILPPLRLKIIGKSSPDPLSDDGKNAIEAAVTDAATQSMEKFFLAKYPPDENEDREFAFEMVVFHIISTDEFAVVDAEKGTIESGDGDATRTRTRTRKTLRVFEREEAEVELDMLNENNFQYGTTHRVHVHRALEGERYGTSLVFSGTLTYEYLPAPPEVSRQSLQDLMEGKSILYEALRDLDLRELDDLESEADLTWEVLTPEPTASPAAEPTVTNGPTEESTSPLGAIISVSASMVVVATVAIALKTKGRNSG